MPERPGKDYMEDALGRRIAELEAQQASTGITSLIIQGVADQVLTDISFGDPAPSVMGEDADPGTGTAVARANHVHDRTDDAIMFWMSL